MRCWVNAQLDGHVLVTVELTLRHAAALARFVAHADTRRAIHNAAYDHAEAQLLTEAMTGLGQELAIQGFMP